MYTISITSYLTLFSKALLLGAILFILFTAFRGLAFPDEGYIVNTGQRIIDGQVLYRDFDFVYTPLAAFATSLSFLILGTSIFSERVLALLLSLLTFYMLVRVGKLITHHSTYYLIPATTYVAWGPTHINFIWPGMWAVNFAIIANCLLFEAVVKKNLKYLYLSGVFLSLVVMTKQNFALAAIINLIFLVISYKPLRAKASLLYMSLGISIPIYLFLIYTSITNSTWSFLQNSYVHVFQLVLLKGSINTPLLVGSSLYVSLAKLLIYSSPLLLSLVAMIVVWKKDREKLILVSFVALFFLFGFRPVTDYVHLTPLLALSGLPLLILIAAIPTIKLFKIYYKKISLTLFALCSLLFALTGVWSSLFYGYYRWSPPLISQNTLSNNPRVGIWTDDQTLLQIKTISDLLDEYSQPKEEVFLNYYAPMVYFLTDRRNPTRYDYTGLPKEYQADIIHTLSRKKTQTILTFYLNKNDKSVIGEYINKHYESEKKLFDYEVWKPK